MFKKIIDYLEEKQAKRFGGTLLFYMVFDPRKKGKNVISHFIDPEIRQDELLDEHLKIVAGSIRMFYKNNPKKLERILKIIKEEN